MLNTSRLLLLVAALSPLGLAQEEKVRLPQEVILAPGQTASHFARMFRGAFCEVEKLVFTVTVTPENQKLIRVNFPKAEVGSEVAFVGNCRAEVWRYMPIGKYIVSDVNSGVTAMAPVPEPIGTKKPALQTRTATKKSSTVAKAAVPTPVKKSAPAPKAVVASTPKPLAPKAPAKVAVRATPKPQVVAKVPTPAKEKKQVATKVTPKVEQPVQPKAKPQVAKALPPPPAPKLMPTPTPHAPPTQATQTPSTPPVQTEETRRKRPCMAPTADLNFNALAVQDCEEVVQKGDSQAVTTAETVLPSAPIKPTSPYPITEEGCAIWEPVHAQSSFLPKPDLVPWCNDEQKKRWNAQKAKRVEVKVDPKEKTQTVTSGGGILGIPWGIFLTLVLIVLAGSGVVAWTMIESRKSDPCHKQGRRQKNKPSNGKVVPIGPTVDGTEVTAELTKFLHDSGHLTLIASWSKYHARAEVRVGPDKEVTRQITGLLTMAGWRDAKFFRERDLLLRKQYVVCTAGPPINSVQTSKPSHVAVQA